MNIKKGNPKTRNLSGIKRKWKWKSLSCVRLWDPMDYSPGDSLDQTTVVGSLSLLQGIFPAQGLNPGLLHCRWILYQLIHKGSPRILEWVAYQESNPGLLHCGQILYQLSYIIAKGSVHQKDTTVPNIDAPNYRASKFMKQNLIELKRET